MLVVIRLNVLVRVLNIVDNCLLYVWIFSRDVENIIVKISVVLVKSEMVLDWN